MMYSMLPPLRSRPTIIEYILTKILYTFYKYKMLFYENVNIQ